MKHLEKLLPYASPSQRRSIEALVKHGSAIKAAEVLGRPAGALRKDVSRARKKAAKHEPELHNKKAPPGYRLKGVSTLLDGDGNVKQTWVKTTKEHEDPQAFLEAFREAVDSKPLRSRSIVPVSNPEGFLNPHTDQILTVYPMGDPHIGLLAWPLETGAAFDLKIAEENLVEAVDKLVSIAPCSEEALIINLGDFYHSDNQENRTARSGHALDVDSRWAKVLRVGIVAMVRCIDRALLKHRAVTVINEIGNHDDHSSVMLSVCLSHHYRDNPRVTIDTSPALFHWYEFGKNLIGVHHGHTCKAEKLPGIMAFDKAEAWGRTKHRYWYVGHVHHESKKEFPGVIVESFRTLAARDAWHAGAGYRSGRSMVCDVLHREHGRIARHEIGVSALRNNS